MMFSFQSIYYPIMTRIGVSENQASFTHEGNNQHSGMGVKLVWKYSALQSLESDLV